MKIVVMDDVTGRRTQIVEGLSKNRHEAVTCQTSNDFLTATQNGKIDLLLLDMDTWNKGKSMYNYFGLPKKLENVPFLFYNADEGFSALTDRNRHEKDQVLRKPSDAQTILDTVQQSM